VAHPQGRTTCGLLVRREALREAGHRPAVVRIHFDPSDAGHEGLIAARCHILQAEMHRWTGAAGRPGGIWDGTLASLVAQYETDPDSPYHEKRQITRLGYSKHLRLLCRRVGQVYVDETSGADVRRWYKNIVAETSKSYAYLTVSILKAVLSYGASLGRGYGACATLRTQLTATRFENGPPRTAQLTYEQLCAFRAAAHAAGRPSMALGLTLQYDGCFRARDVIGEYVREDGASRWQDGLVWTDLDEAGALRRTLSKTRFTSGAAVVLRIADYPDLAAELERIPAERRVGPMVINERTGLPYTREQYRATFRPIARAAGIPDDVWCMDARAGAITETYEAGGTTEGAMGLAGHTQPSTSRKYMREKIEQASTVARLRVGSRKK